MGKSKRQKANRYSIDQGPKKIVSSKPTALVWLRSAGVFSILTYCFKLSFWPAVAMVYFGLLLLLVDLLYERFVVWLRWTSAGTIVVVSVWFTVDVTLHKDPLLAMSWKTGDGKVLLCISNDSAEDYHDIDITIRVNPMDCVIQSVKQMSNFEGVTLYRPVPASLGPGDFVEFGKNEMKANYQRVRCEKLPHSSSLVVLLDFRVMPKNIAINGVYTGKIRVRDYSNPHIEIM